MADDVSTDERRDRQWRVLLIHGPYGSRKATWWERLFFAIRRAAR